MADVVVMGCVFSFLFLNTCYGLPGLVDNSGPIGSTDNQLINEPITINKMMVHQPRYKCHQCEPPDCPDDYSQHSASQLCVDALYCYKSSVRGSDGSLRHSRGCSTHFEHYQFTCWTSKLSGLRKRHAGQHNITCCKGDLCNDGDFPDLLPYADTSIEPVPSNVWKLWATVTASVLTVTVIGAMAIFVLRRGHRLRVSRAALHKLGASTYYPANMYSHHITSPHYEGSGGGAEGSQAGGGLRATAAGDSTLREYLEGSLTSGSGAGLPLMVQRTLAKQLSLVHTVGKGRFGEVWRALWYADSVAVKIFFSRDEASWRRETEIYSTVLLRHDNILAYIGSDMTSVQGCTQLWLITSYHPLGSLYDNLQRTTFTRHQMMVICLSIANGLLHLHTEIYGTQGKPAIAHCDIKSKNILMKSNGTCCIADLGLATTRALLNSSTTTRQGTTRYMPPELLDHSMDMECFESYRRWDIYAFALVLWEVWTRTEGPSLREYRPPYGEWVAKDPGFDEMKKIVCVDGARPSLAENTQRTMSGLAALIRECWHGNPSVRLPVLRIKKSLLKLAHHDNSIRLEDDNEVSV